jgi:hypothetical protein
MKKILLTGLLATMSLWAGDSEDRRPCDAATLRGEYGFSISGSRPSPGNGPIEQIIGVALTIFDGGGNLSQTDNIHGSISGYPSSAVDRPGTGSYTLNEDCTGTMTLSNKGVPVTLTLHIVVVNNGEEIRTVVTEPATVMVTSNGVRVHRDK